MHRRVPLTGVDLAIGEVALLIVLRGGGPAQLSLPFGSNFVLPHVWRGSPVSIQPLEVLRLDQRLPLIEEVGVDRLQLLLGLGVAPR